MNGGRSYLVFTYHAVELAGLVALRPSEMIPRLTCAILTEVLCCLWDDVLEDLHFDATKWFAAQRHVEKAHRVCHNCNVR